MAETVVAQWPVLVVVNQCEQELRQTLGKDKRLFLAETADLDDAQQEVLMAMLGVSRPIEGGFSAAADFLLDGRLDAGRLELRIMEGRKLGLVAKGSFALDSTPQIAQWLDGQVQRLSASQAAPAAGSIPAVGWGKNQAALELEYAKRIGLEIEKFKAEADLRRVKSGLTKMADDDAPALQALSDRRRQHLARAAQLDPESEPVAWAAIWTGQDDLGFLARVRLARKLERFVERFPKSNNIRVAYQYAILHNTAAAAYLGKPIRSGDWGVPRGIDHDALRLVYLARVVKLGDAYAARYAAGSANELKDTPNGCSPFPDFISTVYLRWAAAYMVLRKADETEIEQTVKRWSDLFDAHPAAGPHSDFLRLRLVALHDDRVKFLEMLTDMQRRHPDPKDDYWTNGYRIALNDLCRLCRFGTVQSNFDKWHYGKGGIGGLPYDGYDPAKDTSKPVAVMELE